VPDCYAPKSKYQLFHIPFNKETSLEWRRLVGSREEADKWHNAMVCEQHFNEEDFYVIPNSKTPGKRRLKRGAVPCLKLPDKSQLAEGRRTIMMEDASKSLTETENVKGVRDLLEIPNFMSYLRDEEAPMDDKAAARAAFDNVGFESAGTAIRAVAEDIEIRTEEDGSIVAIVPSGETDEQTSSTKGGVRKYPEESRGRDYESRVERAGQRLEKELSQNKKTIMALKERVLELQENKRALQSSNSAKRCSIGRKKSGKIKLNFSDREDILMDVLGKHFSKAQVRCLMKGDWQMGKNWDDKDYKLALTIFTISKRCYHYIRNHHILPLPSYTCLKRHLVEDTPIRREVEAFLASESQCNCGQENCQHNLAFPINTAASTETTKKEPGVTQSKEVQLAVMNILEEQEDLTEEDEEMEEDGGGADQQVQYTYTI